MQPGKCATVFSILSLFNYPLNEVACPPVSTVYSPTMPSEASYTLMRAVTRLSALIENKINTIRGIDRVSRVKKLPAEHDSFSQCNSQGGEEDLLKPS